MIKFDLSNGYSIRANPEGDRKAPLSRKNVRAPWALNFNGCNSLCDSTN